ncbi:MULTISPECIES: MFS transporter [unclassified Bradyrhizobium]|uniref:MFS transporter n=1 Tax=unclassified Bradyrhizobium TaxID=2631580 RepID=UPI0028E852EC|nr:MULTISPECIES: MFS transporter [unclassified Bradyrhizobium]
MIRWSRLPRVGLPARSAIISGLVTGLCMPGDAVLYAVLPVYYDKLGVSAITVGMALAANRLIRMIAYMPIGALVRKLGARNSLAVAVLLTVVATIGYGATGNDWAFVLMRILWGLAYGMLMLAGTLVIAESDTKRGTRFGIKIGVGPIIPTLALFSSGWLIDRFGLEGTFYLFGVWAAIGFGLLPLLRPTRAVVSERHALLPRLNGTTATFLCIGFSTTAFVVALPIALEQALGAKEAVAWAGVTLGLRQFAFILIPPLAGPLIDRVGPKPVIVGVAVSVVVGLLALVENWYVLGSTLIIVGFAAFGPSGSVLATRNDSLNDLSASHALLDLGTGVAPLFISLLPFIGLDIFLLAAAGIAAVPIALQVPLADIWRRMIMPEPI